LVGLTLTFLAVTSAVQKNCVFLKIRKEFTVVTGDKRYESREKEIKKGKIRLRR
jgi:hypothetical protein